MDHTLPYIDMTFRVGTPVESGDWDRFGIVCDRVDGYHAQFAGLLHPQPFERVEENKWGWTAQHLLFEVLDRQRWFISGLQPTDPGLPVPNAELETIGLRALRRRDAETIDLVLIGKTFAHTQDQAIGQALTWWHEITALLPYDYDLAPISTAEQYLQLTGVPVVESIINTRQIAEVRRYETFIPRPPGQVVCKGDYVLFPFAWHPRAMEHVWRALALLPGDALVDIVLRPTCLYEAEELCLSQLYAAAQSRADDDDPLLQCYAGMGARLYRDYALRLARPFLMRLLVAGQENTAPVLARALGTAVTHSLLTDSTDDCELVQTGYEVAVPTPDELPTALRNLAMLELDSWGTDQAAAPFRRFRYLFDAAGVHTAFQLPFLPRGGLPGVRFTTPQDL